MRACLPAWLCACFSGGARRRVSPRPSSSPIDTTSDLLPEMVLPVGDDDDGETPVKSVVKAACQKCNIYDDICHSRVRQVYSEQTTTTPTKCPNGTGRGRQKAARGRARARCPFPENRSTRSGSVVRTVNPVELTEFLCSNCRLVREFYNATTQHTTHATIDTVTVTRVNNGLRFYP